MHRITVPAGAFLHNVSKNIFARAAFTFEVDATWVEEEGLYVFYWEGDQYTYVPLEDD